MRHKLLWHSLALVAIDATAAAQLVQLPFIARRSFDAGAWQTAFVTAASPTLLVASIFWNALLQRMTVRPFLAVFFAVNLLPTMLIAFAGSFWSMWTLHAVACIGAAGWSPVKGELLRRFYDGTVRGRALGVINAAVLLGGVGVGLLLGYWLDRDPSAFRIYLPGLLAVQTMGLVGLAALCGRDRGEHAAPESAGRARTWRDALAPLAHMRRVLREDRRFWFYEAAFMTYGAGYMICEVLRPLLLDDHLHLTHGEIALTTQVVFNLSIVALSLPAGWVLDRIGPVRTSALAFAGLALYPLALLAAQTPAHVGLACVLYGIAMAGVQQGWMLGPVSLAPRPEQVADYVAIHTTLVGLRGLVAQFLGMLVHVVSGSFVLPFLLAALCFLWGSRQMVRLTRADGPSRTLP